MKRIAILTVLLLLSLFLAACSGTAAPAPTGGDVYVSQNLPVDYEGALAVRNQLALGTLALNEGDLAVGAEQAQALIPLWQALRSTQQAGGTAQAEVSALLTQIEAAMTPEQLQAIAAMKLTQPAMQDWATTNGITLGSGGGQPGQGSGMSPEARATKQAAEGVTTSSSESGNGSKLTSALIDAVIASLEAQAK